MSKALSLIVKEVGGFATCVSMRVQAIIATQRFEINSPDRFAPIVTTQTITH